MSDFAGMEDLLQDFLVEAGDLLSGVDNKLVDLERAPGDKGLLNDIFRGFHTIKGGAGFLNAEMFSMMVPLVLIAVACSGAAAATAGEEDRGTADLLLSMPLSRGRVIFAKALAMVIAVLPSDSSFLSAASAASLRTPSSCSSRGLPR